MGKDVRIAAGLLAFLIVAALAPPVAAQGQPPSQRLAQAPAPRLPAMPTEVDVALVLAVDISFSMDLEELALQRAGYVEALRSPEVHKAIANGLEPGLLANSMAQLDQQLAESRAEIATLEAAARPPDLSAEVARLAAAGIVVTA
jgi:hypothetical protein